MPAELIDFLHVAEKTLIGDDHETHSDRVRGLIERIKLIKADQEVGARYMRYQEEKALDRKEAFEEGRAKGLTDCIQGMLAEGLDPAAISRITKKTPEEIEELIARII